MPIAWTEQRLNGDWYLCRSPTNQMRAEHCEPYGRDSEAAEAAAKALNDLYEARKQNETIEEFLDTLRTTLKSARSFHLATQNETEPDWQGFVKVRETGRSTITIEIEK